MPPRAKKYTLTYFNIKGRGNVCRLLFAAAGVSYEDKRIDPKDWHEVKPKMPQGTVPVLEIDGKLTVSQSQSLARYLAREFNLYGKTNLDGLLIDQLNDTLSDLQLKGFPAFIEKDETKKAELLKTFKEETLPRFLGIVEKLVDPTGKTGYSVGGTLSLADIVLLSVLESMSVRDEDLTAKFPKILACRKKTRDNPKIKAYLEKDKATSFFVTDFSVFQRPAAAKK